MSIHRVIDWSYNINGNRFEIGDGFTNKTLLSGFGLFHDPEFPLELILKTMCDALNEHTVTFGPYDEKDFQNHSQVLPKSEINSAHEKDSA